LFRELGGKAGETPLEKILEASLAGTSICKLSCWGGERRTPDMQIGCGCK